VIALPSNSGRGIDINDGGVVIKERRIVSANNAFYEMAQKTPDEANASDFSDVIAAPHQEEVALRHSVH
jgi:hypothetical protein